MARQECRSRRAAVVCYLVYLVLGLLAAAAAAQPPDRKRPHDFGLERVAAARRVTVELDRNGFVWPRLREGTDTVFAVLEIRARRSDPRIEVSTATLRFHQYFERGARGRRHLNLSPLAQAEVPAGTRVALAGHHLRWQLGTASLYAFDNRRFEGARVLVVAPHPDDAEIAAFGLYSGTEADVVTVTAGDAGGWNFRELYPEAADHYRMKGWIRTWDSVTVPFFGGVQPGRARNLGYYDATLKKLWEERPREVKPPLAEIEEPDFYRGFNVPQAVPGRTMVSTWPSLVADLEAELREVRPEVIAAPHPFLDAHRDHQFTTVALIEALEEVPELEPTLLLYTNHPVTREIYPFGPRDGVASLLPWFGEELELEGLYSHPLSEEQRRRKLIALEAMHDLRRFELGERPSWGRRFKELMAATGRALTPGRAPDYSYYRRAGRPNEIFFVLSKEAAREMKERFLVDCGARVPCESSAEQSRP